MDLEIPDILSWFGKMEQKFRNYGRDIELLFSYTKISHGRRIYGKSNILRKKITMEDIKGGFDIFSKNMIEKKENTVIHNMYI